ncbi:MAG TPA: hypothetical protein VD962_03955 [Rubricoccaceae bacterium]|nr:hypothetical protein [Rubricoccaceae bacterium]
MRRASLLISLALAACAGGDDAPAGAEDRVAEVEAMRDRLRCEVHTWAVGDAESAYDACFDGDALVLIDEAMDLGEYGSGRHVYVFEGGRLAYYREARRQARPGFNGPEEDSIHVRLAFDERGRVTASEKTIDGTALPVEDIQVEAVRNHAATLQRAATDAG